MSSPDKNKPAGKPGKRNRKPEQRNHEAADRQISSMPNEEQDAEEQMGAAAEPGHVGSNGAAAQPAEVASISPAAEPADEALIDALTEPADIDPMDASDDADEIRSISPAPEPAHAAQISRVAEPAEVTSDTTRPKRADVVPIAAPAQPADVVSIAAAAFEGVPISVQTIATAYGDYTRKSFEQTRSFVDKLSRVRSLDKALEVQIEFARQAYETFVGEMQKICGLHNALAKQSLKPLQRFMTNTMRGAR
jgi:hypothetical protein